MQQSVVVAAQQHQIIQCGLTSIGPVLDVVRIDVTMGGTPRESTTCITRPQSTPQRRVDGAGFAPHIQYVAFRVFVDSNHRSITTHPP